MASNTSDPLLPMNSDEDSPRKPTLGPYDVLDGQGRRAGDGNKYYRSIVRLFKRDQEYIKKSNSKNSDKRIKKHIAEAVYDHIICKGGCFRNGNNEIKSKEDSIKKITQSLRDYSRHDRHVYNNKDVVDGSFPEIKHIEEKISECEDVQKQYEVAIKELQNLTERMTTSKELAQISRDGSWSGQKRKYEETHTVGVEGKYVPYSRNPFLPTPTGYIIHQNLIRRKETRYYEVPHRFHLSNPYYYETCDTFGNWKCDYGIPQELGGESPGQFSPVKFSMCEKEFSSYHFYRLFSMNSQAPVRDRVIAKRRRQGRQGVMESEERDFVKQACRKRTLVASLAYDFNEFLKNQVSSKTEFPLIVISPCRIYDRNILVEKKLNEETWKVFTMEVRQILLFLYSIPVCDSNYSFLKESKLQKKTDEDIMLEPDEISLPADQVTFFESPNRDTYLALDFRPNEEAGEKKIDDEEFLSELDGELPFCGEGIEKYSESLDMNTCPQFDPHPTSTEDAGEKYFDLNGQNITFNEIIHLFMAFAFMKTDHQVAIYKVKGSLNSNMSPITYELTDPSIHTSRNHYERFGDDDEGQKGIEKFSRSIKPYEQQLQMDDREKNIDTSIPRVFEA